VLFERTEVISRAAAANAGLLVLALACFLAGVHFDWVFLLVGTMLVIMVVAIGYLEQYVVWIIMLPVILATGWVYFQVRKRRSREPR
jgi:membrane protein implicated in regulation of membrane protease activity